MTFYKRIWNELIESIDFTKSEDSSIASQYLKELEDLYNSSTRFYHNLNHIEALLKLVEQHKEYLQDPVLLSFAIFYHDAIYDSSQPDNEEKSAELANQRLRKFRYSEEKIKAIVELINATKSHDLKDKSNWFDGQFLLDIDLSILATNRKNYQTYTTQIRAEYAQYPDVIYKLGRKKVLKHFLAMPQIYKTDLFLKEWETTARNNLMWELGSLSI